MNAQMLLQATAPTDSTPNTVSFAYDPYGNIKTQDWSSSNATRSAPLFMEFAARQYGPSGTVSRNRITDTDFDYDINGNLRKSNSGGLKHTMLWDGRNRMTSVQTGFPGDSAGTTLEARYSYDGSGYRTITNPDSGDGKPVVSLRDGSGQLIADYVYSPASARLILEKDYLYGLGQLLVERRRTSAPPSARTQNGLSSSGNYNLALTSGTGASSYTLDVRDESGNSSSISSVTPDAQGAFSVPESSLFPDTTNLLRIKKNTGEAEPYSAPVSIVYSTGVTSQSVNTVRAISVHRNGTNLVLRWSLAAADGKLTKVHFDRAAGGGLVPLNPTALPAGVSSLTVSDQALAAPCGDFRIERIVPGQSSGTMTEFGVGMPPSSSSQNLTIGNGGGCGEDPPPPPPGGGGPAPYTLADSFHHRDHLGNLRIETDSAGLVMRDDDGVVEIGRHDYYPFGTEMTADLGLGSRKRFTGHERDAALGLDYMLARYYEAGLARFLSTDPLDASANAARPQTWNRFVYASNTPLNVVDPTGMKDKRSEEDKQVLEDSDVKDATKSAWSESKPNANPDQRQGVTFTVVKNDGGGVGVTDRKPGNVVSSDLVTIGATTKVVMEGSQAGKTAVADVHTHPGVGTSPINPDTQQRQFIASGPSPGDKTAAQARGIPNYIVEKNKLIKLNPDGSHSAILTGKHFRNYMGR